MSRLAAAKISRPADEVGRVKLDPGLLGGGQNAGVMLRGNDAGLPPRVDGAARQSEAPCQRPGPESLDNLGMPKLVLHSQVCTKTSNVVSTRFSNGRQSEKLVQFNAMGKPRAPDDKLSDLARAIRSMREETGLSVRDFAQLAGFPSFTTYAYYESAKFTGDEVSKRAREKIARVLLARGIEVDRVAQLGRLPKGVDKTKSALEVMQQQIAQLQDIVLGRSKAS